MNTFWEITKRQLEEKKAELRNKEREMEEAEERHQVEIKVYKQKVKHLLYEHQNNITELKAESKCVLVAERSSIYPHFLSTLFSHEPSLPNHNSG